MVDTLSAFAGEVTRVAREVGTEGILGGQATVPNVAGTWKDLTDNVNSMANNLTSQVRNIAQVTTAVAKGDLTKKIDVDARGEILELKTTINTMVDQLSSFAAEVTRVAREVGREGRLGGQAEVEGVSGTWKRLTENVNELAGTLTRQVRAIAEVTSAVATGDLTRTISVEAGRRGRRAEGQHQHDGPLAARDHRGQPAAGLAADQPGPDRRPDAGPPGPDRGRRADHERADPAGRRPAGRVLPRRTPATAETRLRLIAGYGLPRGDQRQADARPGAARPVADRPGRQDAPADRAQRGPGRLRADLLGDRRGPPGQRDDPADRVRGPGARRHRGRLAVAVHPGAPRLPRAAHGDHRRQREHDDRQRPHRRAARAVAAADRASSSRGSRSCSSPTRNWPTRRRCSPRRTATSRPRTRRSSRPGRRSRSAPSSSTRPSRYKSQFLANMSHELRTPLNSLLVLARLLAQNPNGNLTGKQVEYATVIHSSGSDLLRLINDILDLTKVEAGKMDINPERFALTGLIEDLRGVFGPLTEEKRLGFTITHGPGVPADLVTDKQRLRQILYNLLSNAVKFTERGRVELRIETAAAAARDDRLVDRVLGHRHRHRHRPGQPHQHLLRLPAGRRHHEPPVRRHRARPGDLPRGRRAARRRGDRAQRARPRQHVQPAPAARPARRPAPARLSRRRQRPRRCPPPCRTRRCAATRSSSSTTTRATPSCSPTCSRCTA